MVDPQGMCDKHLLGEHVECHMLLGTLRLGKSIQGFLKKGLLEPQNLVRRHDELADEMTKRGFKHKSPICESTVTFDLPIGTVNVWESTTELTRRCPSCNKRIGSGTSGTHYDASVCDNTV